MIIRMNNGCNARYLYGINGVAVQLQFRKAVPKQSTDTFDYHAFTYTSITLN